MIPTIPFQTKIRFQSKKKLNKVLIWRNKQKKKGFASVSLWELLHFFENKRAKNTKKRKKISLPRSNIFLNKCYQNKSILLDLPKITSICTEIKGKHKYVGGVTFVSYN